MFGTRYHVIANVVRKRIVNGADLRSCNDPLPIALAHQQHYLDAGAGGRRGIWGRATAAPCRALDPTT